jgi:hypothetical protein
MTIKINLRLLTFIAACALAGYQPTSMAQAAPPQEAAAANTVTYSGGDGSTIEKAVLIQAPDTQAGVRAEYTWLKQKYPGYKRISQALRTPDGKAYDLIKIETTDGQQLSVYFDITAFFGKF